MAGDLKDLQELLVGGIVESVEKPDPGVSEAVCKLTVRKVDKAHEFHLHATGLGWWVGELRSIRELPDGTLAQAWEDVSQMVESMIDHLTSEVMDEWDHEKSPFFSQDDPLTRCIGFRCVATDKTWYASLRAVKKFAVHTPGVMETPAQRRDTAEFLGVNHRLPVMT